MAKVIEVSKAEYEAFFPEYEEIDYDEELSLEEIYNKYIHKVNPLIVEAATWTDDYCFAITEMGSEFAKGKAFSHGDFYKNRRCHIAQLVRVYNGPSTDKIKDYFKKNQ
ncbi:MAG: hypothetical protein IJM08_03240 [Firmicutes bacterium]|nr:hypothetical protein [Bacillota bacterium]